MRKQKMPRPAPQVMPKTARISPMAAINLRSTKNNSSIAYPVAPPILPRGVVPKGVSMAMDASLYDYMTPLAAGQSYTGFAGYPHLSGLAARSEYRAFASALSSEMVRKWIKFTSGETDGDETKERIKQIEKEFSRLRVKELFARLVSDDALFGRAQLFLDVQCEDRANPLIISPVTVSKGALNGLTCIEPMWTTPAEYNSTDPSRDDFFKPRKWYMLGQEVHASRLLTVITRPMPDILKPAFNFSGISLSQLAEPYVNNWLRTRQSVSDLINNFSITVLATSMDSILQGDDDGQGLNSRLDVFAATRTNRGVLALDKEREELVQVNTPLGGLHELQAQSQEQMCAVSRMPSVVLTGISPNGMNASSEGELKAWYDWIAAQQAAHLDEPLKKVLQIVQLSLFGEIDDDIHFEWQPLQQMDAAQESTIRKTDCDTALAYINGGVISPEEERERLARDKKSLYQGLDLNAEIQPSQEDDDPENEPPIVQDAEFKESDHPRANNGQFGNGGGEAVAKNGEVNHKGKMPKIDTSDSRSIGAGIADIARNMGFEVYHHGSVLSQSDYVEVRDYKNGDADNPETYKIRISNHQLPMSHKKEHGKAEYEVSPIDAEHEDTNSTNPMSAIEYLSKKTGVKIPDYVKNHIEKSEKKESKKMQSVVSKIYQKNIKDIESKSKELSGLMDNPEASFVRSGTKKSGKLIVNGREIVYKFSIDDGNVPSDKKTAIENAIKNLSNEKARYESLIKNDKQGGMAHDADKWITVHPNGKGNGGGTPALIGEGGIVKGGMGGKFNGKNIKDAHGTKEFTSHETNAETAARNNTVAHRANELSKSAVTKKDHANAAQAHFEASIDKDTPQPDSRVHVLKAQEHMGKKGNVPLPDKSSLSETNQNEETAARHEGDDLAQAPKASAQPQRANEEPPTLHSVSKAGFGSVEQYDIMKKNKDAIVNRIDELVKNNSAKRLRMMSLGKKHNTNVQKMKDDIAAKFGINQVSPVIDKALGMTILSDDATAAEEIISRALDDAQLASVRAEMAKHDVANVAPKREYTPEHRAAQKAAQAQPENNNGNIELLGQAKSLGVKNVSSRTSKEKLQKLIGEKESGVAAVNYLQAGKKSKLPQYENVTDESARLAGETAHIFPYSIDLSNRGSGELNSHGIGSERVNALISGGIIEESKNNKHRITRVGEELLRHAMTKKSASESAPKAMDEENEGLDYMNGIA